MEKAEKTITITLMIMLVLCCFLRFINVGYESIISIRVKGVNIALIFNIIVLYSVLTNKKKSFYISSLISILGYCYTFYTIFSLYKKYIDLNEIISFDLGFYLYIICFFIQIVNIIVYVVSSKEQLNKSDETHELIEYIEDDKFLLSNYVFGLGKRGELYNKLNLIKYNENCLQIIVNSDVDVSVNILYDNIKKIEICKNILVHSDIKKATDDDYYKDVLSVAAYGTWAPLVSNIRNLYSAIDDYENSEFRERYEITIEYTLDDKDEKIMLISKNEPYTFVDGIDKISSLIVKK